jgi:hypothetical protein
MRIDVTSTPLFPALASSGGQPVDVLIDLSSVNQDILSDKLRFRSSPSFTRDGT